MPRVRRNEFPSLGSKDLRAFFRTVPRMVGRIAVNFYKDSFKRQGYIDTRYSRWEARKRPDRGRATLVKSGRLRRSIRVIRVTPKSVSVGSSVPYAAIHNFGGTINHPGGSPYLFIGNRMVFIRKTTAAKREEQGKPVKYTKPHQIKIPRRQFMGASELLNKRIIRHITNGVEKHLG